MVELHIPSLDATDIELPSTEGWDALWAEGEREDAFWAEHYQELLTQYPDEFVAVKDGKVIAHHPDLFALRRITDEMGLDPTRLWVRFLTAHWERYLR
jgi:hypothetical protein